MAYTNEQKKILLKNEDKNSTIHEAGDKLGTYYIADNPKYFEPQRQNNFIFYVEGLNGKLNIPYNTYAQQNAEEVLKLSVNSSSVPHFTISTVTLKRGNNTMKFAGVPEFGEGQIALNDFIGAGTKDVLLAWQKQAYDVQTEKVGLATDYKVDAYLLEYTPEYQLVRTWILRGCWISGISEDAYDHDNGGNMKILNATIQYDKAYIDTSDI